jgi:rhodanese-related sulfurtransferase
MSYTKEELQNILESKNMSSSELVTLLEAREKGEIGFNLVDIREVFEYDSSSIDGTDLLIPTSVIQQHIDKLEAIKDEPIVLYCRTGNRTGQIMHALDSMGFPKVVHLAQGIITYGGKTSHGAKVPNQL